MTLSEDRHILSPPEEQAPRPAPAPPHPYDITRIVLRPGASPMPLGFFTVGIATCMLSALQAHILAAGDRRAVAYVVLPAFVLQIIVAIRAFSDRDTVAATLMASFAATWLIDSLMFLADPAGAAQTLAVFFFTFSAFVVMMAFAARPKKGPPGIDVGGFRGRWSGGVRGVGRVRWVRG